jgi:magnesium-transporting ATPase (P-type)
VRHPDIEGIVRVVLKGAPEVVIPKTAHYFDASAVEWKMTRYQTERIMENVMTKTYTKVGKRCIAYAYKDYREQEFKDLLEANPDYNTTLDYSFLE